MKCKILIAEDSLTQAQLLQLTLERAGYEVSHAPDGDAATEMIGSDPPSLVISDVMMPGKNGYELCEWIKSDPGLSPIPVLLLTSLNETGDILIGLECNADGYLMKPYDEEILLDKVHSLIRKGGKSTEKVQSYLFPYEGTSYEIRSSRERIIDMMATTYRAARQRNEKLLETQEKLEHLRTSLQSIVEERTADLRKKVQERRALEGSVENARKSYRRLLDHALMGVAVVNGNSRIRYVNPAMARLLNYTDVESLAGLKAEVLFEDKSTWDLITRKIAKEKRLQNLDSKLITCSRELRPVILNVSLTRELYLLMAIDVTQRLEMEAREQQLVRELKIASGEAEESSRQKSRFLYSLSHEIKTPLNAITGFSGLASDTGTDPANRKEYIQHVRKNTLALKGMITNILDLAQLEAGKVQLRISEFPLHDWLMRLFDEYRAKYVGEEFKLIFEPGQKQPGPVIKADSRRLKQIIDGVMENAIRFAGKGTIRTGYSVERDRVTFFVEDEGPGFPEGSGEKPFERFHKEDAHINGKGAGLGLGLTIARLLVEKMRGGIWIDSGPGKGAKISFYIPYQPGGKSGAGQGGGSDRQLSPEVLRKKRIMVVEDNSLNYLLIKAYLDPFEVDLTWARDGYEAIRLFGENAGSDLVLMDIIIPHLDGFDVAKKLRKIDPVLPIIAVTATPADFEDRFSEDPVFDGVLTKPVNSQKLTDMILSSLITRNHE